MSNTNKIKISLEEEALLQDFSRNVSTKSSALFYGNAFIVSAIPICMFRFLFKCVYNMLTWSFYDTYLFLSIGVDICVVIVLKS